MFDIFKFFIASSFVYLTVNTFYYLFFVHYFLIIQVLSLKNLISFVLIF